MSREQAHHVHESPPVMTLPLGVLALLTAVAGVLGVPSAHGTAFARFLSPVLPLKEAEHGGVTALALAALAVVAAAGAFSSPGSCTGAGPSTRRPSGWRGA